MNTKTIICNALVLGFISTTIAWADVTDFVETFDDGDAGWLTAINTAPTFNPTGGLDGTGAISFEASFLDLGLGTIFRDNAAAGNASGGAFAGDWEGSNVDTFSFSLRHNAPAPVSVFARIAPPINSPGAIGVSFAPVLPNTWTDIIISVDRNSPQLTSFSGGTYDDIFPNVGNIQIVAQAPTGFENSAVPFTFELDNVGISTIPEPATTAVLAGLVGLMGIRRRS